MVDVAAGALVRGIVTCAKLTSARRNAITAGAKAPFLFETACRIRLFPKPFCRTSDQVQAKNVAFRGKPAAHVAECNHSKECPG